ncbi:TrmB family transcriptional regulator [Halogeometricum luteum]|uniref:Sugar-specific transcriptional regulator TrmB n=1 Tax=Halogeometricum luteum TaxID=2950537 RepID=A0ABU2G3L1_9EURY|nr:helix-turn-helix domain-containing protein [Halogeometricum sp. S3BR5-2]MDS0295368.1 hypothetical protein [Halogeometricum sp. S3BR5-2]
MSNQSETAELLTWYGLSTYEASVFVSLLELESGTAKEVSKHSGVPQSQVYGAADSLQEQGFIEAQESRPRVYQPIDVDEAISRLKARHERRTDAAERNLRRIQENRETESEEQKEAVWTINGIDAVKSRMMSIISDAEEKIVLGIGGESPLTDTLESLLRQKDATGIDVVVVTNSDRVSTQFDSVGAVLTQEEVSGDESPSRHILIADGETILFGVRTNGSETAIWSSETDFADVLIEFARKRMVL